MTYEEKYNAALEWAKEVYPHTKGREREELEHFFPELVESEDERIRKWLYDYFGSIGEGSWLHERYCSRKEILAWLEKQKEQKPAEWSEEDERKRLACIETINEVIDYERERWEDYNPGKPYRPIMKYDEQVDWLKSLRPQPHWKPSEEQMSYLSKAIMTLGDEGDCKTASILKEIHDGIKSL